MTPAAYQAALTTLSLTSRDVCAWLGVSRRGEALWRESGPSNLAGRLIEMQLRLAGLRRYECDSAGPNGGWIDHYEEVEGQYVLYDDIAPLLAVGEGESDV